MNTATLPLLNNGRPPPPQRDYLSFSSIKTYQGCPLRYAFRYKMGLPEETVSASLVFGSSLHVALEHHFRELLAGNPPPSVDELLDQYQLGWNERNDQQVRFGKDEDASKLTEVARRMLAAFHDHALCRSETKLSDFPKGFDQPRIALQADVYEASHTYKLRGVDKYLTLIEAVAEDGRRYYKAYLADRLDGEWTPLAATPERPFAGSNNVEFKRERWSDSFSHGELLRTEVDEHLEVDPTTLRFLYQGVSDADRKGKAYGDIPWRLGILEPNVGK